jgi:hypothetical protein
VLDVHLNAITRILHRRTASLQTPDYIITKTFCIQGPSATQVKEVLCRSMFCICIFSITGEFESHRNPFAQQKSSANPRPALYCPDNARQGHPPNGNNLRSRKLRRRQLKNYKINSNASHHTSTRPSLWNRTYTHDVSCFTIYPGFRFLRCSPCPGMPC